MNISNELTAKGFLKKLVGFSVASWMSAGISFLITPVFTRVYLPEEVGHINLFTTYLTFFWTICVLALDQALMRFFNEKLDGLSKDTFLSYCLRINFIIVCISSGIVLLEYRFFSVQISGEENIIIPICLSISIGCKTFIYMCNILSRMEKNIFQYTLLVVLTAVIEKVVCTISGFYDPSHRRAIIIISMGYLILSILLLLIKGRNVFAKVNQVPWNTTVIILKFSIPYLPVLLLSWLNSSIPLLVLKKYVDYSSVGIYTNAVTVANILSIIQTGFSAYWGPFIYENYNKTNSKEKIEKIERIIIFLLFFLAMGIIFFQEYIYLLVGKEFRDSKLFFPFLMLNPICNAIADMTGIGIMLSRKSYLNIYTFVGSTSVNLIISCLLVPEIGTFGAGIAVGISTLVMLTMRTCLGGRYYKINNYFLIFLAISIYICVCIINIIFLDMIILKTIFIAIFIFIFCILFRNDFLYLFHFLVKEIQEICSRIKKG